jgi:SAM-dependent methyltransferase
VVNIQDEDLRPADRASRYYLGARGTSYFNRQDRAGVASATYNLWMFEPHIPADADLLDFGCGGGHLLLALHARSKTGVEVNPVAREVAASKGVRVVGSLEEIEDQSFDRIITSHVLEHVGDPLHTLNQLRGLLKPGGLLIWLSPMDDWRVRNQRTWRPDDPDMHLYTWTPLTLGNLLATARFRPLSIRIITHAFPPRLREHLWNLSPKAFHATARLWSIVSSHRQILSVAQAGPANDTATG